MSEYELKDIESLRDNKVREDHQIEYKAGESFKDTKEITRDVSSFANASGGIIIYGMTETKNPDEGAIPEEIIPIPLDKKANSEWLEHIINSIEPKIPNVRIYPILVTPGNFAYVVVVPKGDTAYQASDLKYYRRYNFQRLAMRDQEVRDVMNRTKHPRVILKFDILDGRIYPLLFNEGKVLARHVRCRYFIPCHFLHSEFIKAPTIKSLDSGWEHDYFSFDCHNDIGVIHSGLHFELPNHAISPGLEGYIDNNIGFGRPIKSGGPFIKWQVYADNADPVFGETGLEHCLTGFKNKLPM